MASNSRPRLPGFGLFRRREVPVPTLRGLALLLLLAIAFVVLAVRVAVPFLAVNDRVTGGPLVIEGWAPDYALEETIAEFRQRPYTRLYVTGGPLEQGAPLSQYKTIAELGAATLLRMGMSTNEVQAVPAPLIRKDRTYTSAVELKKWLVAHGQGTTNLTVATVGPHARRTRLMFEAAFGSETRVGILALQDRDYEPARWWRSSIGFRLVTGEWIAYLYARLLFSPEQG